MEMEYGTYVVVPEKNGNGIWFDASCGHSMYHPFNEPVARHGCLCSGCLYKGVNRTLYIEGSEEANALKRSSVCVCEEVL